MRVALCLCLNVAPGCCPLVVLGPVVLGGALPACSWRPLLRPYLSTRAVPLVGWGDVKGKDVVAVVWMNAGPANGSFALSVDSVSFTSSGVLALRQPPAKSPDTGPRSVAVDTASGMLTSGAVLYYSLDNGRSFETGAMAADSQGYSGAIPGQPLGSDLFYYVETTGANGYVSRLPFDAPASLFRYRVDDRPGLLVDDFAGARLRNRLDGGAGLFHNETAGGSVQVYRSARQLRLDYAVGSAQQFAGYFTGLGVLDISAYTTLDLRVRGAVGG